MRRPPSAPELPAADPDYDRMLPLDHYLAVVDNCVYANRNANGSLEAKEPRTLAGRALLRLLR